MIPDRDRCPTFSAVGWGRRGAWHWVGTLVLLVGWLVGTSAAASSWTVNDETSMFAVVTRKAGVGARLAHDHLVVATGYEVELEFDPTRPEAAQLELTAPAEGLRIDAPEFQDRAVARLLELEILPSPFGGLSEKNRAKVARTMLGDEQLDAARFPVLGARVAAVRRVERTVGSQVFDYEVDLALEVRGKEVVRSMAARWRLERESGVEVLRIEALGTFRFTDFGIEPYSAMLGAVRNADEFTVYLDLRADRAER